MSEKEESNDTLRYKTWYLIYKALCEIYPWDLNGYQKAILTGERERAYSIYKREMELYEQRQRDENLSA